MDAAAPRLGAFRSGARLGVAVLVVILLAPFASNLSHVLGALTNPFATETHERVQPPEPKPSQTPALVPRSTGPSSNRR